MTWKIPRIWPNETIYIFGGGPTLLESIEGYDFNGRCVLGVNSAFRIDNVDILYFGDAKFYWWNRADIQAFPGIKITSNRGVRHGHKSVKRERNINIIRVGRFKGLDARNGRIGWNRSSGAAAINVAIHLGAKQIILLGYDMRRVAGKKNWLSHEKENTNQNPYDYMLEGFHQVAKTLGTTGVHIINCTPKSKIRVFPKKQLKEIF